MTEFNLKTKKLKKISVEGVDPNGYLLVSRWGRIFSYNFNFLRGFRKVSRSNFNLQGGVGNLPGIQRGGFEGQPSPFLGNYFNLLGCLKKIPRPPKVSHPYKKKSRAPLKKLLDTPLLMGHIYETYNEEYREFKHKNQCWVPYVNDP